jgi:hypothetical protein
MPRLSIKNYNFADSPMDEEEEDQLTNTAMAVPEEPRGGNKTNLGKFLYFIVTPLYSPICESGIRLTDTLILNPYYLFIDRMETPQQGGQEPQTAGDTEDMEIEVLSGESHVLRLNCLLKLHHGQ